MKTITTSKNKESIYCGGEEKSIVITTIIVDGEEICRLSPIKNAVKEGYDSRVKFTVSNLSNILGLKYTYSSARSIKQVIESLSK
jgi:hypothetical protein